MRRYVVGAICLGLLVTCLAFSQNAQLAGIVTDASGALVPGVTITATNTETGVVTTTITNESGAYAFPSLQPGKAYKLSASLPGFQTKIVTNLELASSVRQNFELQVSGAQTLVEVSADNTSLAVSTNSATVGDVLPEKKVSDLPLVGNNVLSLLTVLPGVRISAGGAQLNTIGGLGMNTMNVTRDGLTSNDTRFGAEGDLSANTTLPNFGGLGAMSPTTINPDLVGEVRLILSPVDAELGRGNSQIQIQTRSGTNKYSGAAVWNIQNSALNANTWSNNRATDPRTGAWAPITPDWRNVNQYTVSYGGPIVRNKTFFFALWDQNISKLRSTQNLRVLTPEARNGIVRFWEGWANDSSNPINNNQTPTAAANPTVASVDVFGKPLMPQFWPDGSAYNGRLVCFSVFGTTTVSGAPFAAGTNTSLCPSGVDSAGRAYTALAMTPPNGAGFWDPKRPVSFNQAGYFAKILNTIPLPNDFDHDTGDGLVTANYRYTLSRNIGDPTFYNETLVGNDPYSNRKQLNIKIDQNFKSHRISGGWTYQMDDNVVFRGDLPNGLEGVSSRRPNVLTVGVTSTLSPNMLNEAHFGVNINKGQQNPPWTSTDDQIRNAAQQFLGEGGVRPGTANKYPVIVRPQLGIGLAGTQVNDDQSLNFDNFNMATRLNNGTIAPNSFNDPLYQVTDTISWTQGKHVFKFGGDYRAPHTSGYAFQPYVTAAYGNLGGAATASPLASETAGTGTPSLGATTVTVPAGQTYASLWAATATNTQAFNFRQNSRTIAANLAYLLTDSIGTLNTPYWISSANDAAQGIAGWQDVTTQTNRIRNSASSDYAFFVKDDYKIRPSLTLNLGLRYEYYAPPYLEDGLTSALIGLGSGLFGAGQSAAAGGQLFNNWLQPGNLYLANYGSGTAIPAGGMPLDCKNGIQQPFLPMSTCDPNSLTTIQYVGSGSQNPNGVILPRDKNNFGPAVGFAWQVPWFGAGKTTVRGGYQVTFQRAQVQDQVLSGVQSANTLTQAATANDGDILAITGTRAINYDDITSLVPRLPANAPGTPTPIYARNVALTAYAPDLATAYTQNLTLSVTRSITRNMTLDVRYIGTLARKLVGNMDINSSTVMYNPELFKALEVTRAGGNDPLFDQMFAGLRLAGVPTTVPVVNGTTSFGSEQLRQSTTYQGALANGNFTAVANTLVTGTIQTGSQGITGLTPGPQQVILRNGCNRIANGLYNPNLPASASNISTRCFPENYLVANPQVQTATYNGNFGRSNYHALQVGFTLRPTQGFSIQSTYSWSKAMQLPGTGYTDPLMREIDRVRSVDNLHNLRTNGTVELPLGPNKLFFGNTSGWAARLIERWQTSFILNMSTGQPSSITGAGTMRYANARYVATVDWKEPNGHAEWNGPNGNTGTYFGTDTFYTARDPQCADTTLVAPSIQTFCTINALAVKAPVGAPRSFTLNTAATGNNPVNVVYGLVSPLPGQIGTLGNRNIISWGVFFLDANIQKSFQLTESKALSIRVDATNILNHPQLAAPSFAVGNTPFGQISSKGGAIAGGPPVQRNFQGQVRLTF